MWLGMLKLKLGFSHMSYYIYENWQAGPHKAVVHLGSCSHCNQGGGASRGNYDPNHGEWHGPFETKRDAERHSQNLRGVVIRKVCGHCHP